MRATKKPIEKLKRTLEIKRNGRAVRAAIAKTAIKARRDKRTTRGSRIAAKLTAKKAAVPIAADPAGRKINRRKVRENS